ncbi:MAG TPA: MarR family transcriptional regulator [Xanthobacteraceae bacterium]|nr:MarR family transcriptional regulator [Xanthobacteraceae bacterium]
MAPRSRLRALNGAPAHECAAFPYLPFNKTLPMLLLATREAVTQRFRHLHQAYGLTEQQWRVIRALAEVDGLEIHALSALCRIHAASLSRILPKLDRAGLIARSAKAADQRCVIVSLKPRGRQLIADLASEATRVYERLARDVGAERLARIYEMLEEFIALLEASGAPTSAEGAPAPASGRQIVVRDEV